MSGPQIPGEYEMGQLAQTSENAQPPQMDRQQDPQSEMPSDNENAQASRMNGKGPEGNDSFISFGNHVTDGTISQETYEAITKFMEENKPELQEGAKEGERSELPEGESPEMKEGEGPDFLKDLLEAGVITR